MDKMRLENEQANVRHKTERRYVVGYRSWSKCAIFFFSMLKTNEYSFFMCICMVAIDARAKHRLFTFNGKVYKRKRMEKNLTLQLLLIGIRCESASIVLPYIFGWIVYNVYVYVRKFPVCLWVFFFFSSLCFLFLLFFTIIFSLMDFRTLFKPNGVFWCFPIYTTWIYWINSTSQESLKEEKKISTTFSLIVPISIKFLFTSIKWWSLHWTSSFCTWEKINRFEL